MVTRVKKVMEEAIVVDEVVAEVVDLTGGEGDVAVTDQRSKVKEKHSNNVKVETYLTSRVSAAINKVTMRLTVRTRNSNFKKPWRERTTSLKMLMS